jgi:hypothetical protein
MDKNTIKNRLTNRFVSEETTPGIKMTKSIGSENKKINAAGVKDIDKTVKDYEKSIKGDKKDSTVKFNYNDKQEEDYHAEIELGGGMQNLQYDRTDKLFNDRAKKAIKGDSTMGNAKGGNAEAAWGASSDDFGQKFIDATLAGQKKKDAAEIPFYGLGDDIENLPKDVKKGSKKLAMAENNENNNKPKIKESMKRITFKKEFEGSNTTQKIGHALTLIPEGYRTDKKVFEISDGNVTCKVRWEGTLKEGKAVVLTSANKSLISEDMSRMKALMGYKSSDTLGLVKGKSRVNENAAFGDVWKKTKKLLGESDDIEDSDAVEGSAESIDTVVKSAPEAKKHIQGSVSTEKGTKAPAPKKGEWEKISVPQSADAKKHVEGTASTEKGTKAPAPKVGEWDKIKVSQSADAKKHVESGTATHTATATAKVVKESNKKGIKLGENYFAPMNEEDEIEKDEEEEEEEHVEPEPVEPEEGDDDEDDSVEMGDKTPNEMGDDDDDDSSIDEPEAMAVPIEAEPVDDIKVAPSKNYKKFTSKTTGEHFLLLGNKHVFADDLNNGVAIPEKAFEMYGNDYDAIVNHIEDAEREGIDIADAFDDIDESAAAGGEDGSGEHDPEQIKNAMNKQ